MLATLGSEADRATHDVDAKVRRIPAVRVLPVPRSEPPTDDELRAAGLDAPPMAAQLLPLDLPTGAQVRRGPRVRSAGAVSDGAGAPAGDGAAASGGEAAEAGTASGDADQTGISPIRPLIELATADLARAELARTDLASAGLASAGLASAGSSDARAPGLATDRMGTDDESAEAIELRLATRRLLATCVEVVGGYRPIGQLRPFCQPERFDSIVNRLLRPSGGAGRGHGATRASVVAGHTGPPRAGRAARTGPGDRVTVRRVQICDVSDGVAEIAVVMARRDKVWAMAIRMELARGRWHCTHLEVL